MSWITEKTIKEKRAKASQLVEEAGRILNAADTEGREVNAEEREKFDSLHAEAKKIGEDVSRLQAQADAEQCFAAKIDIPHREIKQRYSLLKAIRQMSDPHGHLDGIEKEVSDEIAHRTGKQAQGFYIPTSMPVERFDAPSQLNLTSGAGAIQTTVDTTNFIELLRSKTLLQQLGVQFIGDLVGDLALPKQTGGATAYWVTEGNSPTASNATIGQVLYQPKTCGAYTDMSRKFIKQTSIDAEMFARNDLARCIAVEVDRVGFNGSGEGAEPEGLMQNADVPTVAIGVNGGAPTWAKVVELESTVAAANADVGAMSYVTSPAGRGKMKTTEKATNYPAYIWGDDNTVNGYAAFASTQIPANLTKAYGTGLTALLFGVWSDLIVTQWGGIDILVDPYTGSSAGTVRVVALTDMTVKPRHVESFAKIVDLATA